MQPRPLVLGLVSAGLLALAASPARAAENEYWDGGYGVKAERRSDVVLGANLGLMLGTAVGYPNEVGKIDDPAYASETGFGVGTRYGLWLGGALKDWFTFGVGGMGLKLGGGDATASGGAAFLHLEVYPLYPLGGALRDFAIYTDFGAGSLTVDSETKESGDAGLASLAGIGGTYELYRLGHFAFAPTASYLHVWSQTASAHFVDFGVRAVFYGGPG